MTLSQTMKFLRTPPTYPPHVLNRAEMDTLRYLYVRNRPEDVLAAMEAVRSAFERDYPQLQDSRAMLDYVSHANRIVGVEAFGNYGRKSLNSRTGIAHLVEGFKLHLGVLYDPLPLYRPNMQNIALPEGMMYEDFTLQYVLREGLTRLHYK